MGAKGIIVRNSVSNSLLADLPRASITGINNMGDDLFRIHTQVITLALKFIDPNLSQRFVQKLDTVLKIIPKNLSNLPRNGEKNASELLPDLNDPNVQEYLVKLLCSEDFSTFVDDLEVCLTNLGSRF